MDYTFLYYIHINNYYDIYICLEINIMVSWTIYFQVRMTMRELNTPFMN